MARVRCLRHLLVLLLLSLGGLAHALSLHRDGDDLYASGTIVLGDELALQAAHESMPVRRLILVNSPGGAVVTSLRIARWLEGLRITTVAWGPCMSACSLIFMAGEQRQFAHDGGGRPSMIGIHGPYNSRTGKFSDASAPIMLDYYKHRMGAKFDAEVIERAIYKMTDPSGFLVVPDASVSRPAARAPRHCPSAQASADECTVYPHKSAQSLGIVTHLESVRLSALPPAIEPRLQARSDALVATTLAQRQH
jgi:ATP-dependent protease ClpP protease subunit